MKLLNTYSHVIYRGLDYYYDVIAKCKYHCSARNVEKPPMDVKVAPKCLFSRVLCNDNAFYLRRVQKKSENQNLPPCFEKVFFRKITSRGLQSLWYNMISLVYTLWCWRYKHLNFFWVYNPLKNYKY